MIDGMLIKVNKNIFSDKSKIQWLEEYIKNKI